MMRKAFTRLFSVLGVLVLLLLALPASVVLGASLELYDLGNENIVTQAEIGDRFTVRGYSFGDYDVYIYISSQDVVPGGTVQIDDEIKTYHFFGVSAHADGGGDFSVVLPISGIPSVLTDGSIDENVHSGVYWIYAVNSTNKVVLAKAPITIIGNEEISLSDDEGQVGDEIEIDGENFPSDEDLVILFDGDEIDIEDGDESTDENGDFRDTLIVIPESTAGEHTITVTMPGLNLEVEATFTVEPRIELDEEMGPPGTEVEVTGTGFGRRADLDLIEFDGDDIDIDGDDRTDSFGSFEFTFIVPADLGSGTYTVSVEDEDGNYAEADFAIAITSAIDKTSGAVGDTLTITGSGFPPDTAIGVTYDNSSVTLSTATTGSNGTLSTQFSVPVSTAGPHSIVLTVGTYSKTFTFTMESQAPDAPSLIAPITGSEAEQPITFDWSDVTDDSGPVKYIWQISNDPNFASLAMPQKELSTSGFTMTAAEELEKASEDAPYYWRVMAIDAASNQGDWSAVSNFYTGGFNLNVGTWVWWVLGGIGLVLIISLGFLIGRRSMTY